MRNQYLVWSFLILGLTALVLTEGCRLQNATSPSITSAAVPTATPVKTPVSHTATPTFTPTPVTPTPTPTPLVINMVDASNFKSEVLDCKIPVMVDCTASWCYWCGVFDPIVQSFATDYAGKVKVVKVDCSTGTPSFIAAYGVAGYPTAFFFVGGAVKTSEGGEVPESILISDFKGL